ncbi:hypothetical protein KPL70_026769 [Citrus sinensis]|nr:hypothetical protein KPL70_026769 [Citrus sinensis]
MVDAIVSVVLEQLISMAVEESKEQMKLVTGVSKEVKKLTCNLRAIQAVLNDADQRQVQEEGARLWLDQLKDASCDMEDVQKYMFDFDVNVSKSTIVEKPDQRVQTTSVVDESEIFGREYEKNELISKLLREQSHEQNGLPIISLVGLGGIGKTTLGQLAYNNDEVVRNFDKRMSNEKRERLEKIGRKIVGKCKGLPLAIKTIGSPLQSKGTEQEWQNIFESEMWELEEIERDYTINKEKLIQLWMAQGYFSQRPNKEIDVIGEECFDIIARRSFFQEFVKNDDDEILSCKMHDIVHDFAQFLSKNECFTVEIDGREEPFIDSLGQNVRHSMVKLGKGAPFPISFCSVKRLRSLLIDDNGDDEFWLTEIEKLPETLCELYNLQLLNVESCQDLKELPQGFGKLINLMYLLNRGTESLRYLPAGIERLTSLRRVEKFVVGRGVVGSKACGVESLRNLNLLRYCYIYGLGDLGDVGEARSSELENKKTSLICFFILVMEMTGIRYPTFPTSLLIRRLLSTLEEFSKTRYNYHRPAGTSQQKFMPNLLDKSWIYGCLDSQAIILMSTGIHVARSMIIDMHVLNMELILLDYNL